MFIPQPHVFLQLAPKFRIVPQPDPNKPANTQAIQVPLNLNREQRKLVSKLCEGKSTIVLKSRQIGSSTAICFFEVMLAIVNPGIKIGIFVHNQKGATELLSRCRSFLVQHHIYLPVDNTQKLVLQNGSEIHALTAGGGREDEDSNAGRAFSFQFLHISELAYWTNQSAFAAILATSAGSQVVVESTGQGNADLFWKLYNTKNEYEKVFFSSEEHDAYQDDPKSLTEEQWQQSLKLGATNKRCAAWFHKKLQNQGGDLIKFLHDYPLKPEHSFQVYDGKWINVSPPILSYELEGFVTSDTKPEPSKTIKIFKRKNPKHRYAAGVDTSGGVGRDGNAIAVIDKITKELVAFWKDNKSDAYDIRDKLIEINKLYSPDLFVIEMNGIGRTTYQIAQREGIPAVAQNQTTDRTYQTLLRAKKEIEKGTICGPEELAQECAALHLDRKGDFKGMKDGIMAIGLALIEVERNPYEIETRINREEIFDPDMYLNDRGNGW